MENTYFATFIPGTEDIVADILSARLPDFSPSLLASGAVAFTTTVPYSELNLFCFNNIFRVLYSAPAAPTKAGLEGFLRGLPAAPVDWQAARARGKARTFRLVVSCKNQLVSVSRGVREAVEKKLAAESRLRPDRSLPDREFWALARDDGQAWFLMRLTRHKAYDKLLHPGELHPELAYMMCWLSQPSPLDVFLEPFCGYGAIPAQRAKRFPFRMLTASDISPKAVEFTRQKLGERPGLAILQADALNMGMAGGTVNAIVTDPPWGIYEDVGMELAVFYRRILAEFARLLCDGGRAVILTAAKRELAGALEELPQLVLSSRYDILVSGKKCGLFVLKKGGLQNRKQG